MTMKDDPDLEDAMDGLQNAERYAHEIGESRLALEIARCYQKVGSAAPPAHWTDDPEEVDEDG